MQYMLRVMVLSFKLKFLAIISISRAIGEVNGSALGLSILMLEAQSLVILRFTITIMSKVTSNLI